MYDNQIKGLIASVKLNANDPNKLSELGMDLASLLASISEVLAEEKALYSRTVVTYLDYDPDTGKKRSVAEAERRAEADTALASVKTEGVIDAIKETLTMIRYRLNVLSQERKEQGFNGLINK